MTSVFHVTLRNVEHTLRLNETRNIGGAVCYLRSILFAQPSGLMIEKTEINAERKSSTLHDLTASRSQLPKWPLINNRLVFHSLNTALSEFPCLRKMQQTSFFHHQILTGAGAILEERF